MVFHDASRNDDERRDPLTAGRVASNRRLQAAHPARDARLP
jgi:hypothetical protein